MSYCTNPADDGRAFGIQGADTVRKVLASDAPRADKYDLLGKEWAAAADYYNWLFDRQQELKGSQNGN